MFGKEFFDLLSLDTRDACTDQLFKCCAGLSNVRRWDSRDEHSTAAAHRFTARGGQRTARYLPYLGPGLVNSNYNWHCSPGLGLYWGWSGGIVVDLIDGDDKDGDEEEDRVLDHGKSWCFCERDSRLLCW